MGHVDGPHNYTVLQRNILDTLETDEAQCAFLWACTLPDADRYQYKAEAFAREVDWLAQSIWPMIQMAADVFRSHCPNVMLKGWSQEVAEDLHAYVMGRHTRIAHPGRKASWEGQWKELMRELVDKELEGK